MYDFCVIVPVKNAEDTVAAQIDALVDQSWPGSGEVVVVDNGSNDNTAVIAQSRGSSSKLVRVLDASRSIGAGAARNFGAAHSQSRLLLFCDADDVVAPTWISAMVEAMETHAAATGPLEVDALNPTWLADSRGRSHLDRLDVFLDTFPYASSCNFGIHRELFHALGGFDETFLIGEDVELCHRVWRRGVTLGFASEATVAYRYRHSSWARWQQGVAFGAVAPAIAVRLRSNRDCNVPPRAAGLRQWFWLLRNMRYLRTRSGRARWSWVAAGCVGRVAGSIRAGSLLL